MTSTLEVFWRSTDPKLRGVRESDRPMINGLLRDLARGRQLARAEIISLFIIVRGDAPEGSMLADLGNCFAHEDRKFGPTRKYLERYAEHLINGLTAAAMNMITVEVLFPVDRVINELATTVTDVGLAAYPDAMLRHSSEFARTIGQALDGTKFQLKRPDVTCEFIYDENAQLPMVQFTPTSTTSGPFGDHVGIATPLLIST